jgi:hypothetical protein
MAMTEEFKDLAERTIYTALEAGTAVVVAAGAGWVDVDVWRGAGITAVAAALAAVKTWLVNRRS